MYAASHPGSASMNGGVGSGMMDGSGTINPAALNTPVLPGPNAGVAPQPSPRGIKRSHSPADSYGDGSNDRDDDDSKPRKRGRPPKSKVSESPRSSVQPPPVPVQPQAPQPLQAPVQTPQMRQNPLPQTSPPQPSPAKTTPAKPPVIKALPTVRDHTTDQLNPEGDEYIPREYDDAGEKKVTQNGQPLDGREYRCRTFLVPNRGNKLFMLATECARVLGYRDSYLLFNKNRSLYKIIATQAEKDDLIQQEILPYSYRSRQIAIVTARSMFRQFGSRLIVNGRRVRDDYWESKARKQGFTEEDAAGEKRPGAAKQREAAAAEANQHAHTLTSLPSGQIIYSGADPQAQMEGSHGMAAMNSSTIAPMPMMVTDDMRARDYGHVQRPRHEISGPAYHDRTQSSNATEILNHAAQTAEFNKNLGGQRNSRGKFMEEYWKRPHESAVASPQRQPTAEGEGASNVTQSMQSPHLHASASNVAGSQQNIVPHAPQGQQQMMASQNYQQPPHSQTAIAQSPLRSMHQPIRPEQIHQRSPQIGMAPSSGHSQPPSYGYPQSQMWPPQQQQPQPSPLSQHHSLPQYGQQSSQQSPHPHQSPMHASPQLHNPQSTSSMHGQSMGYQTMGGIGQGSAYPGMNRAHFQPGATSQHFMQSTGSQQPGMPGYAPGPPNHPQQPWQTY